MTKILTNLYGILTTIALTLGLIVAIIFFAALIIGSDTGTTWALVAGEIMTWGIMLAAVAMLAGIIYIYATREHSLMMEKPSKDNERGND